MIDPTGHSVFYDPGDPDDYEDCESGEVEEIEESEGYIHEPDDDPMCDECFELCRHCRCRYASTEDEDRADRAEALFVAEGYPELPFPEDEEGDYDEEPF